VFTIPTNLRDDPTVLQQMLRAALAEIERQRVIIAALQRNRFGRRSEKLGEEAVQLGIEDLEQSVAEQAAVLEAAASRATPPKQDGADRAARTEPAKRNRGALPADLPRVEQVIDIEDKTCPCCGGSLHLIGEDTTEMLDHVPEHVRVRVIRRPRYGCRSCGEAIVQAPAPDRPIAGGMATEAMVVHVVVSKYCDHTPLYRQVEILARQGIKLDRSTLCNWVGRVCWWLAPLHELLLNTVLAAPVLFADDTTLPVLDPGRGRTKTGRLWCYAVDPRPWNGPGHPAAAYVYSEDRKGVNPAIHLQNFSGVIQVDGYQGFGAVLKGENGDTRELAYCFAHARRKFYELYVSDKSPIAWEALQQIAALYQIEAEIRGTSAEHRRSVRQQRSRPLIEAMHEWLPQQLERISGSSDLAKAIRYSLNHWKGLTRFLDDGRLELDTNTVERAIKPIVMARSLCTSFLTVWKHWKCVCVVNATRTTFSGDCSLDRRRGKIVGSDLVRRARYHLFGRQNARLNQAPYQVAGNPQSVRRLAHGEPFAVFLR
jgi:transposase